MSGTEQKCCQHFDIIIIIIIVVQVWSHEITKRQMPEKQSGYIYEKKDNMVDFPKERELPTIYYLPPFRRMFL